MALEFNCDSLENPAKTLEDVANLRMHILTAPIDAAMDSLVNGSGGNGEIMVNYRTDGKLFVIPKKDRVVVVTSTDSLMRRTDLFPKFFCRSSWRLSGR